MCLCPVRALTLQNLNLETSFLVSRYTRKKSKSISYMKVIRVAQGQVKGENACMCPVQALNIECTGLQTASYVCRCILITPRSRSSIKVRGQDQGHTSVFKYMFVGDLPSTERQSRYTQHLITIW